MNNEKLFIFDLGGVIIKSVDANKIYYELKPKIDLETWLEYWYNSKASLDAHQGLISDEEHIQKLLEYSQSDKTVEDFLKYYLNDKPEIYLDTENIIISLQNKGYKVALLSNLRKMDYVKDRYPIEKYDFDYLFLSYEIKLLKPSKEIYDYVIKVSGYDPKNIYFFDDNKDNVLSALELGINAYQVTGENIKEIFNSIDI